MNQYVAFSGGIDSTALALISPQAQPVFTDTGWEFPELYKQIDKFEQKTGRCVIRLKSEEHVSLPEYANRYNYLPGHSSRYCTRIFKIDVYNEFIKKHLPAEMLIGLRADEDPDDRVGNLTKIKGLKIRYPLREKGLNRIDCLKICIDNDLLPRYPVYMARGGCIGCFYKRKSEVQAMIHFLPDVMDDLQRLEESVQDKRGKFALLFPNVGLSIKALRSQGELFNPTEVYRDAADDSDKAAACGLFCHR